MLTENKFYHSEKDLINGAYKTGELLPCPFCGDTRIATYGEINEETGNIVYHASCQNQKCLANVFECLGGEETADECRDLVVAKWNRRHNNANERDQDRATQAFELLTNSAARSWRVICGVSST